MRVVVDGRTFRVDTRKTLGEGGEASVVLCAAEMRGVSTITARSKLYTTRAHSTFLDIDHP